MKTILSLVAMSASLALAACGDAESVDEAASALGGLPELGKHFFDNPLPGTNGRSCATCHVQAEHTTLRPASVAARLAANPADPLFDRLDADDPAAAVPTWAHLGAGLVRVTLPLPDNVDLLDARGAVVTGSDRRISLWRAVPTVENTLFTAPYQHDGREPTLASQALSALEAHSAIAAPPPPAVLQAIAAFERTVRTPLAPPPPSPPGSDEARGRALFQKGCQPCHGGLTGAKVLDPSVTEVLHPVLGPDGTVALVSLPDGSNFPAATRKDQHANRFMNIGIAFGTYLGQIGAFPNFTGVDFPQYRLRFYADGTRTQRTVDLPPALLDPVTGAALVPPPIGPNLAPQAFTVDPGRALITGDPVDFEAFDVPQIRGIARTAPYFHDNSAPDLQTVLDIYSLFILPQIPSLGLPRVVPPAGPGLPPEALTQAEKQQIIAYLETL